MYYEHFLFTRNTRQDFTAFVRPAETTNRDVSALAGVIGYINNVTWLTRQHPAFYCFPLGAYIYLLRHYNSERYHAGRAIGVLEGIAVQRTQTRTFAAHLQTFLTQHDHYLNASTARPNVESSQVATSNRHSLNITRVGFPSVDEQHQPTVQAFATQQTETRLYVPFTATGRDLLLAVLIDPNIPPLVRFAFGTNSDAVARLASLDVQLDVIGYFGIERPALRDRAEGQTRQIFDHYDQQAFTPPSTPTPSPETGVTSLRAEAESIRKAAEAAHGPSATNPTDATPPPTTTDRGVLSPREMRRRARDMAAAQTSLDTDDAAERAQDALFEGEVLTPRQMRRRILEAEAQRAADDADPDTHHWLVALIRRLFGKG